MAVEERITEMPPESEAEPAESRSLTGSLEWRCTGPYRGGRVVAVAGDPIHQQVFYFGACAGGVWKTTNGGVYWENVSDGFFKTSAVGALAVADSDPNVIYAGMGETCIRGNVSHGDGVYRSTDAGKTWQHLGLDDTRYIAKVRIHPQNPDLVYVAALGHIFGPNRERGIYRSKDGGKTWEQILFRSEETGAIDLSMDPHNPRILYAAFWQVRRSFWNLSSGGPESSLYKSTDGGDTWTEITQKPGLPKSLKGKMGIAVSPAKPDRVWAIIEAEGDDRGLYRSDDGGESWELVNGDHQLVARPWYYCHVYADPQDANTVYVLNLKMWKSTDGGKSITEITTPHGDNHDLWLDPQNNQRMIEGNDGGACVSFDGGATFTTIYNQPTAQFYHVVADNQFPYRLYGTQQDNSSISVPSRTNKGAIPWVDCYTVGSGESGYIAVNPQNPNIVYEGAIGSAPGGGGIILRYDHSTNQTRIITVWPEIYNGYGAKDLKYRFQWTFPIVFSPFDSNILYTAGNRVFKSTDEGSSWEPISPDLTRNDVTKMEPSGGPITKDTTGAEHYGTIFAFIESPKERGLFWAGSDDGLIHISRDGGQNWENITPPDLPEWTLISMIEASPHDAATAYVAATRYKLDDNTPYLYKTNDYGKTWTKITNGIPADDFTRVIREDPNRRGLLYTGTETNLYYSLDDGAIWKSLRNNLPVVPIYDIIIKERDLVAATHGRSFWILDDLTPLYQLNDQTAQEQVHLFKPRETVRLNVQMRAGDTTGKIYSLGLGIPATYIEKKKPDGTTERVMLDAGKNPPPGVFVTYYLKQKPEGEVSLTFKDAQGNEIKRFVSKPENPPKNGEKEQQEPWVPVEAGANRFIWNMRYADAHKVPGDVTTEKSLTGPLAAPGTYQVELKVGDQTYTQSFEIVKDPRVSATQADLEEQFKLLIAIRDKLSETQDAINQIRTIKQQAQELIGRTKDQPNLKSVSDAAQALIDKLTPVEEALIQTQVKSPADRLNLQSKLNEKLASLPSVVSYADFAPTRQSYDVFHDLSERIDQQLAQLQEIVKTDVPAFNTQVREASVPAISVSEQ